MNTQKKRYLFLGGICFLNLFILAILLAFIDKEQITKSRAQIAGEFQNEESAYVEGEILIKLKDNIPPLETAASFNQLNQATIPSSLKSLHQKYPIQKVEKVFKTAESPEKELAKIKQKFSQEIAEGSKKINEQEFLKTDLSKIYKLTFDKKFRIEDVIASLAESPEIEYAEPNYIYKQDALPNDPFFLDSYPDQTGSRDPNWNPPHDYQWNIKKTNSSENWQQDTSSIIAAIVDTGVDINHPELGLLWQNPLEIPGDNIDNDANGCIDDINGCNLAVYKGDVSDYQNHGTHIAGVISAKTNNGLGIAGTTSNTKIMAVKVCDSFCLSETIAKGIYYASTNGARILSISLGGPYNQIEKDALDSAVANNVIPVVSAGNGNKYSQSSNFPASYEPAITVGAVDENLDKLKYSDYGPNVDVFAPGGGKVCDYNNKPSYCSNILSLKSSKTEQSEETVASNFLRMSGTSMAVPHVTGIIALLLAQHPKFELGDIENYIRFNSLGTGIHTENQGWGVINSTGNIFIPNSNIKFKIVFPAENAFVGRNFNVAGIISADDFSHYEVFYRLQGETSWKTEGVELVNEGKDPQQPAHPQSLAKKMAEVTLPEDSPRGIYEVKTTFFLSSGQSLSSSKNVYFWQKEKSLWLFDGDKQGNTFNDIYGPSLLLADLEDDGFKEIVVFGEQRFIVYNHLYQLLWEKNISAEIAVGNVSSTNEGREIVAQTKNNILVFDKNGQEIPSLTITPDTQAKNLYGNLLLIDTNNNGKEEIVFYHDSGVYSYEQDENLEVKLNWSIDTPTQFNKNWPLAGDVNGDGTPEIILVNREYNLTAVNHAGEVVAVSSDINFSSTNHILLADINIDGKEEVIVDFWRGGTMMLKFSPPKIFNKVFMASPTRSNEAISVADFNNDGLLEVYLQDDYSTEILKANGDIYYTAAAPFYYSNPENMGLLMVDFNNDQKIEILSGGLYNFDRRQYLNIDQFDFGSNLLQRFWFPWRPIVPQWQGVNDETELFFDKGKIAIDDLDHDDRLEIVIAGVGIIQLDYSGQVFWPHKYHDFQRTGSFNFLAKEIQPVPVPSSTPTPLITASEGKYVISEFQPVFLTKWLPNGCLGKAYSASFWARDLDEDSNITMKAEGLPTDLTLTDCKVMKASLWGGFTIKCLVSGTPQETGQFEPNFTVIDGQEDMNTQTIRFKILSDCANLNNN